MLDEEFEALDKHARDAGLTDFYRAKVAEMCTEARRSRLEAKILRDKALVDLAMEHLVGHEGEGPDCEECAPTRAQIKRAAKGTK